MQKFQVLAPKKSKKHKIEIEGNFYKDLKPGARWSRMPSWKHPTDPSLLPTTINSAIPATAVATP